ncbi:MAG TPA: hypothetical protein VMS98_12015 [Thermoanaerobaculia bacterium]|nr:hypothetical protein [Thermoanaerobaculia bacterium]
MKPRVSTTSAYDVPSDVITRPESCAISVMEPVLFATSVALGSPAGMPPVCSCPDRISIIFADASPDTTRCSPRERKMSMRSRAVVVLFIPAR